MSNGHDLNLECEKFRRLCNEVRPHESLGFVTPEQAFLMKPDAPPTPVKNYRRSNMGSRQKIVDNTPASPKAPTS
jgi:hypothetical protein